MSDRVTYRARQSVWPICPAYDGSQICGVPLPCDDHNVRDVADAWLRYGNAYYETGPIEFERTDEP
jgi:hypothetical protein